MFILPKPCMLMRTSSFPVWWDDPRPASVLVSRRSVPGVGSRHEQLRSHRSDRGEGRLEDQHGFCGPQKSRHSCGKQLSRTHVLPVKGPIFTRIHVYLLFPPCVPLEIQPKDLQEEAEERQLAEAQLSVLLLRRRQQRPIALRLGECPGFEEGAALPER